MLPLLISLLVAGVSGGSYLITAPRTIQPGSVYDISVDILNTTDVEVIATLQSRVYNGQTRRYDLEMIQRVIGTFDQGSTGTLSMFIPDNTTCNSCQLSIRGRKALQFERTLNTYLSTNVVALLIQTDKAIYKPGQTVRFRVLAVYPNLELYEGTFNIEITDPNNNKIKVLQGLYTDSGLVEDSFDLSEQPLYGSWQIFVSLEGTDDTETQAFTVEDYDLPRFEVTVTLPPYGLTNDVQLTGTVKADYTFGQPVKGMVELHIGPNEGPNFCGDLPKTTQISFEIDGEATFSIPKDDFQRAAPTYNGAEVKVTAFVKEAATGVVLNGSSVIKYHRSKYQVKFLENTPSVFKPGLPYTAFIQATTPDDMPPTGDHEVSVYTYVTYNLNVADQSLYSVTEFSGTYPLPGQNISLPANGVLPFNVEIPSNATSIHIKVTFEGETSTKTVSKTYSKSNNYIQLSVLNKNVKSKSDVTIKVEGTEALGLVSYRILSRGGVVASSAVDGKRKKSFTFDLAVSPSFAPTANLLAYYSRGDEIVADSLAFNVEGLFENEVSISFSKNESEPGKTVYVELTADPDSMVNILAVDQSVLLLKSGNDITPEKVDDAISNFTPGDRPEDSEFALSHSARSADETFQKIGLSFVTDVQLGAPPEPRTFPSFSRRPYDNIRLNSMSYSMSYASSPMPLRTESYDSAQSTGALQEVERIRNVFPESWLWDSARISSQNGSARIKTTVPDTITSWVASAFATNPRTGLGVAPTTATLKVFRPFFVSLTYPSSVIRNEQAVVQATVFNYLKQNLEVTVTLKGSNKFESVEVSKDKTEILSSGDKIVTVNVPSEEQGVVYFPILASTIGVVDIEITAQSSVAADGVRRQMIVQPEGAPVSYNYPIFINIDNTSPGSKFTEKVEFSLPPSLVQDSEKIRAKVTGDLIGSSLDSLTSLLKLPTGCGEQSMVKFAPDLYIAQYLKASGQLSKVLREKIVGLLEAGYQRQLTYQRGDGGFSAFGNLDEAGSTWLTAFVARTFDEAREFIYVDPNTIIRATEWLVDRQNQDGSFSEFGKVLDRNIQGAGSGPGLTAYVLLTLLETQDLAPKEDCKPNGSGCYRVYRWGNATENAVRFLETLIDNNEVNDQFALSVISYALTQAKSPRATDAFDKLSTYAVVEGNLKHWSENVTVPRPPLYRVWRPARVQARPIDILITSYAILTYTAMDQIQNGFPAVKWLTTQRNSFGGFASTHDTTLGLQALSAFATLSLQPDTDVNINVSARGNMATFDVTKENALVLQIQEIEDTPQKVTVKAKGNGFALVELEHSFNVDDELTTPSFDVSTVLLDDDLNSFNLMICTKYLWDRETGMVVQEVSIPSGFKPDLQSLDNVAGLKRSERKGDLVAIYFDKIGSTSICYSLRMTRSEKVAKSQRNFVRTFDYYEPSNQATVFYQPKKLRDSTICDVCDGCCQ